MDRSTKPILLNQLTVSNHNMENVLLLPDLFLAICKLATESVSELTQLELISVLHLKLIRKTPWSHFRVSVSEKKSYNAPLLQTHNFKNLYIGVQFDGRESWISNAQELNCSSTKIKNKVVKKLGNVPVLHFNYTFLDDRVIKYLTSVRELHMNSTHIVGDAFSKKFKLETLNLDICYKFTGERLGKLSNLTELSLWGCPKIKERGFNELKKLSFLTSLNVGHTGVRGEHISRLIFLRKLDINGCLNVEDSGLLTLTNLTCLIASGNHDRVNGRCLSKMRNLRYLDLSGPCLKEKNLEYASDIHTIHLRESHINDGLKYLTNVYDLNLSFCKSINDISIRHLSNIFHLNLGCTHIGDDHLDALANVNFLKLEFCRMVTNEGAKKLTNVSNLVLTETKANVDCIKFLIGTKTLKITANNLERELVNGLYPNINIEFQYSFEDLQGWKCAQFPRFDVSCDSYDESDTSGYLVNTGEEGTAGDTQDD